MRIRIPSNQHRRWRIHGCSSIIGVICMACVANLQYGWTLFVNPIDAKYHWGRAAIQVAFTIFVLIETWLVPVEGYLVDRFGPRWVVHRRRQSWSPSPGSSIRSRVLCRFCISPPPSAASAPAASTAPASATRSSGFPAGAVSPPASPPSGFGAGAALTIVPISTHDQLIGLRACLPGLRAASGRHRVRDVLAAAGAAAAAHRGEGESRIRRRTATRPCEVLRSPVFYVLYVMFVLIAAGGLTMAASMAPIAKDFKIDKVPVELFGLTMPALVFALFAEPDFRRRRPAVLRLAVGSDRPRVHDGPRILHRRRRAVHAQPVRDRIRWCSCWSPRCTSACTAKSSACFPATQGDTFGSKFAAANAGMLYTAKGAGALLVPIAAVIAKAHGWGTVFTLAMTLQHHRRGCWRCSC